MVGSLRGTLKIRRTTIAAPLGL